MDAEARRDEDRQLVEEAREQYPGACEIVRETGGPCEVCEFIARLAARLTAALDERDGLVSAVQARDEALQEIEHPFDASEFRHLSEENERLREALSWIREVAEKRRNFIEWRAIYDCARAALSAARPSAEGRQAPE